jgi:hypothetical protein
MNIPAGFKENIASQFYDKTLSIYSSADDSADDGWTNREAIEVTGTFKGNVQFSQLDLIKEQYGLDESIDISITTSEDVEIGSIVGYDGVHYSIIRAIPNDSHNLLLGEKWS